MPKNRWSCTYIEGGVVRPPTCQVDARLAMNGQSARINKEMALLSEFRKM